MPLEMHSRLMGLWRTTERSAGPVVRMDGGTRKMKRITFSHIITEIFFFLKRKEITQRQSGVFTPSGASMWLAFKAQFMFTTVIVNAKISIFFYWVSS